MKIFFAFLISLFAFTGLASADTCKVNWVNGACGVAKSDDSADKSKTVAQPLRETPEDETNEQTE